MTTIVGNRGQLWTSTLSPHLLSPHLDFPELLLGSSQMVVSKLVVWNFTRKHSFALFCSLRFFALFNADLHFALFCAHLRSFACICVFLRPTAFRTTAFGNCRSTSNSTKFGENTFRLSVLRWYTLFGKCYQINSNTFRSVTVSVTSRNLIQTP